MPIPLSTITKPHQTSRLQRAFARRSLEVAVWVFGLLVGRHYTYAAWSILQCTRAPYVELEMPQVTLRL